MSKTEQQLPKAALNPLNQPLPVMTDYVDIIRHLASPPAVRWGSACQEYWLAADVQPAPKKTSTSQPVHVNLTQDQEGAQDQQVKNAEHVCNAGHTCQVMYSHF